MEVCMRTKRIYDRHGEFIAERVDEGDKVTIYSREGMYLGEYIRSSDSTYDDAGYLIGIGDLLATLIKY
tara:strand:+ start:567 stop:773 length:207 start_codon:yes stop_codon:yes gene_type:complete